MKLAKLIGCLLLILAAPLLLRADDINFDNLATGTFVTNQYAQATFSTDSGEQLVTQAANFGSSLPNFLCTIAISATFTDCAHPVLVNFTNPVNNLTLLGVGVNDTGVVAQVDVFQNGIFSTTIDMFGQGDPYTPVQVDLSGYSNVTSIDIHNVTDTYGIGWDDFIFNPTSTSVPEPSSLLFLGTGLLSLVSFRRRLLAR